MATQVAIAGAKIAVWSCYPIFWFLTQLLSLFGGRVLQSLDSGRKWLLEYVTAFKHQVIVCGAFSSKHYGFGFAVVDLYPPVPTNLAISRKPKMTLFLTESKSLPTATKAVSSANCRENKKCWERWHDEYIEQRWGYSADPWGSPSRAVLVEETLLPTLTAICRHLLISLFKI